MSPIQQMFLGVGAKKTSVFVDDIFSTFLYKGSGSARTINNGIDLSGEGGLLWVKSRDATESHGLFDSVRGATKRLVSNSSTSESTDANRCSAFNNNGFSLGTDGMVNASNDDYTSWTFRKSPAFTICEWTGNGSNRTISHDLGSVPGMIIVKRTDTASNWAVYNRGFNGGVNPEHYVAFLDTTAAASSHAASWNNSAPTSSVFHVGTHARVNGNGGTFVAYVFAGGESTAATARSVDFDGSGDYLSFTGIPIGTNDFTLEAWIHPAGGSNYPCILDTRNTDDDANGLFWGLNSSNRLYLYTDGDRVGGTVNANQWSHVALVRDYSATTTTMYINGISVGSWTSDNINYSNALAQIGFSNTTNTHHYWDGKLSNVRITIGQTLYTSSFRPPTEPLTTTSQGATASNVKLLCCNGSSTTSATVGTITANGDPTASSDSPFDDPAAFVFGENEDQQAIKCGSYVGNGSATGPEIFLGNGWEPQWVLIKNTEESEGWLIFDSMRGIVSGGNDIFMYADANTVDQSMDMLDLTPTGFNIKSDHALINTNNKTYIFTCIRRPDGYVGKPPSLGTGVFAMDVGNGSTTIPAFDSGFPVDMNMNRKPASTWSWQLGTRLQGKDQLNPNTSDAEGGELDKYVWDSNAGFGADSGYDSSYQSWMWKRYAGMDCITYKGNGVAGRQIPHSMNKTIEMMWVKNRDYATNWTVFHKGLNGGSSPEDYYLFLDNDDNETTATFWNNQAPTSTHFTLGTNSKVNSSNGASYIAMLFASVDGISKVGSYTGNGQNWHGIEVGFAPRFYMIKKVSGSGDWFIVDNTRGLDENLYLNTNDAQGGSQHIGTPSSTTWYIGASGSTSILNTNNEKYIYYVHA